MPFKHENKANVGDRIRSYDFEGRTDCYIEGVVQEKDTEGNRQGYACFVVVVDVDGWPDRDNEQQGKSLVVKDCGRIGQTVFIPMETAWMEYDGRIVKL